MIGTGKPCRCPFFVVVFQLESYILLFEGELRKSFKAGPPLI